MQWESRLTLVQKLDKRTKDKHVIGLFKCLCGNEVEATVSRVKTGHVKSCGCIAKENPPGLKHGASKTRAYSIWQGIKDRTLSETNKDYPKYGGRGIGISEEWLDFKTFLKDMGQPPKDHQIDRMDNDKGYSKENCRWVDTMTQQHNKRISVWLRVGDRKVHITEYAKELGIPRQEAYRRLTKGKLDATRY